VPATPHAEKHFTATETVRDVVIGMSDGLTVPFALAAGLSAAVASTNVIVTAGLAEVAAGAIAMGLGGWLDRMPEAMIIRRQTVDHCFGTLKAWMGGTHFLTKTLEKVKTEMSLQVLAYNMKRMINIFGVRPLMQAIAG
jgi:hypothetical protein